MLKFISITDSDIKGREEKWLFVFIITFTPVFLTQPQLLLVLFLAACFNFSLSLVFVWSCHFSFY